MDQIVKQYQPTKNGYVDLQNDDIELANIARDVVMDYLKSEYQPNPNTNPIEYNRRRKDAIQSSVNWLGLNINLSLKSNGTWLKNMRHNQPNKSYYKDLFNKFHKEIMNVKYDPNDEHQLFDECVKVANIMIKTKHSVLQKMKKKNILQKIFNY